jgi:hypothetical protein
MPVYCKLVENNLKKILTCCSISALYVEVYILICVHVLILYIILLINAQI